MASSLPIHSPTSQVLQCIEGSYYVDYLIRGLPSEEDVAELAEDSPYQVYKSLWQGRWIVRVLTGR